VVAEELLPPNQEIQMLLEDEDAMSIDLEVDLDLKKEQFLE
jgi:hypothetical protein